MSGGRVEPVLIRAGWKEDEEPKTSFHVEDLSGTSSAKVLAKTITELVGQSGDKTVALLEYSGYGYAKRGAPFWLRRGLKQACGANKIPLITMFHELYATGKPWGSAFWMTPMQQYIVSRLARLSNGIVTNRKTSVQWLKRYVNAEKPVHMQPVFSNVGEPETMTSFSEREPYAVVFGGKGMKERLYADLDVSFIKWLKKAGIERIVDIGESNEVVEKITSLPVETVGFQSSSVISNYLQKAKIGLLHLPVDCLTKSGVFSSYAAHGLAVVLSAEPGNANPLIEGKHFFRFNGWDQQGSAFYLEDLSNNAFKWYLQEANSIKSANRFLELMNRI